MTRSEIAERTDVNPETLRYYERRGLIPEPPRTSAGYRQYDASYLDRLRFIKRAQALGFTLAEIDDLFSLQESVQVCEGQVAICPVLSTDCASRSDKIHSSLKPSLEKGQPFKKKRLEANVQ